MTDLVPLPLPGLELTTTGARPLDLGLVDADATFDALAQLRRYGDTARWLLGDLAAALMSTVGEAEAIRRLATQDHHQADIERAVAVAIAVPHDIRRPTLSWSHHHEVRRLARDDQDRWLARAEDRGWSVRALRTAMREEAGEAQPPLTGMERLPRPPENALRAALDQVGPDGLVAWVPGAGAISGATVRKVDRTLIPGRTILVVEVDDTLAGHLHDDDQGAAA